ncbi:PREDICTED: E3 ubiquitin-protein ligase CIP8-like [Camelina sativa]|uniref:RING-type E3 ubiquitin transferase n=1 Tax=Camelina sativa TaxID=90675 RepID=A0ABM0XJZ8_CAMSA|nr:PREDICTED: E3 ubiquitin-protein ligase CIP8-like [Camelina sativa]
MEDATETTTYWCHMCSRSVNPVIEGEIITCNFCQSGFVEEEMDDNNALQDSVTVDDHHHTADSLWAPILMGVMNSHHDQQHQEDSESVVEDEDDNNDDDDDDDGEEVDINRQLEAIRRIRSRHSAAISNLLQGIRAGLLVESETNPDNSELVLLINSFNQTISVHEDSIDTITSSVASGSLGDYFIGPGFEALLQRLAENDLNNRYGTPPATKEAVESLGVVKIEDGLLQCTVCLDDFEIGMEAKEMPCKHKFHSDCLLPWLELHSSCPVCRYLLPTGDDDGEPKTDGEALRNNEEEEDISI